MCLNVKLVNNNQNDSRLNSIYKSLQISDNKETNNLSEDLVNIPNKSRFSSNQSLQDVLQGEKTLKKGSSGQDVKIIQESLSDLGFYVGDKIDGKFGAQLQVAIKNFQDNRGLKTTGIVDKETMEALNKVATPSGKKLWEQGVLNSLLETTKDEKIVPSNTIGDTKKRAKIVIDLSEHRLFLYDNNNNIKKVYSVASGKDGWADGRGGKTHLGIKFVDSKNSDPSKVASKLWPETKGKAFGTKLLGLTFIDPKTNKKTNSGEELHGTYARNSIGTDASHGCMRMQNEDIEEIFSEVKVGDLIKVQD